MNTAKPILSVKNVAGMSRPLTSSSIKVGAMESVVWANPDKRREYLTILNPSRIPPTRIRSRQFLVIFVAIFKHLLSLILIPTGVSIGNNNVQNVTKNSPEPSWANTKSFAQPNNKSLNKLNKNSTNGKKTILVEDFLFHHRWLCTEMSPFNW